MASYEIISSCSLLFFKFIFSKIVFPLNILHFLSWSIASILCSYHVPQGFNKQIFMLTYFLSTMYADYVKSYSVVKVKLVLCVNFLWTYLHNPKQRADKFTWHFDLVLYSKEVLLKFLTLWKDDISMSLVHAQVSSPSVCQFAHWTHFCLSHSYLPFSFWYILLVGQ